MTAKKVAKKIVEPITVLPYKGKTMDLSERIAETKWALLDPEYRRMHPPVMCKDYIQDAFWSEHTEKEVNCYGFEWKPGQMTLDKDEYAIEVSFTTEEAKKIENVALLLAELEKTFGFKSSTIVPVAKHPSRFVFKLSREWYEQPIRISFITLAIRVGSSYTKDQDLMEFFKGVAEKKIQAQTVGDDFMMQQAMPAITEILKEKKFPKQSYKDFENYSRVHNTSGIVATSIEMKRKKLEF